MTFQRKQLGQSGEGLAARYLESIGYKIIERNYRFKFGEIDLIAQDGDVIVLVEVKTKTSTDQGRPEEEVDYFKKKKLRLLARGLEQVYPDQNIRIDVVAVDKTAPASPAKRGGQAGDEPIINHIQNAVEANG